MDTLRSNEVSATQEAAVARLADAARRLSAAVVCAELDPDALVAAAERIDAVTSELPRSGRRGALRPPLVAPVTARDGGTALATAAYNPFGVPIEISFSGDGDRAWAQLVADGTHEGPPGLLHGGIASWLMDVILGVLVQARGIAALTKQLDVAYHRPTPLGVPLLLEARWIGTSDRTTRVEGAIQVDGLPSVTAVGTFVTPRERGV